MSQSQHAAAEVTGSWQEDIHTQTRRQPGGVQVHEKPEKPRQSRI